GPTGPATGPGQARDGWSRRNPQKVRPSRVPDGESWLTMTNGRGYLRRGHNHSNGHLGHRQAMKNAYDFTVSGLDGQPLALSQWAGRPLLLVNVASRCGFTPQYTALEQLWQ